MKQCRNVSDQAIDAATAEKDEEIERLLKVEATMAKLLDQMPHNMTSGLLKPCKCKRECLRCQWEAMKEEAKR